MIIFKQKALKNTEKHSKEEKEASVYPPLIGFLWVHLSDTVPFQRGLSSQSCSPKDISISETSLWEENLFVDISGLWSFLLYSLATLLWAGRGVPGRCPSAGPSQSRKISSHIHNSTVRRNECWEEKVNSVWGGAEERGRFGVCPWRLAGILEGDYVRDWRAQARMRPCSRMVSRRGPWNSVCSRWNGRDLAVRNVDGL